MTEKMKNIIIGSNNDFFYSIKKEKDDNEFIFNFNGDDCNLSKKPEEDLYKYINKLKHLSVILNNYISILENNNS